jgi:hypothetical protein
MALNPSIILSGQTPDVIGSLSRGMATGQQANQIQQQNALANLYQTQGAGIAAGDQGALNALAGFDPMAALGVQSNRLGMDSQRLQMDATRQSMGVQAEAAKRAAAEYARGISAEQRQAEAAQLENGLKGAAFFHAQGDRAGYEAFLVQQGIDPAQFAFDQFPAHAAAMGGVLEVLKGFTPEAPGMLSPQDRYKVVGGSLFDLSAEGGPAQVGQGAMQEETVFGPDGKPLIVRGGPGTSVKFTEGQSKDNVYATRAEGALRTLEPIASELTSAMQRAAGYDPTGLIRGAVQSEQFQVAKQAGDEFLQAILRKDTGAAITEPEQALYGQTYLPQPGDGPSVLEAKRTARIRAVEAIKAGMNIEQITVTERAIVQAAERAGGADVQPSPASPSQPRRLRFNPATGDFE